MKHFCPIVGKNLTRHPTFRGLQRVRLRRKTVFWAQRPKPRIPNPLDTPFVNQLRCRNSSRLPNILGCRALGGHAYDTWRKDTKKKAADDASFWPLWLAQDVEGIAVYTLAYEAPASNWLGTSMPLQDRAVKVLEILLSEPGLKTGPIIFVCHSLGGLIVKQILLDLQQEKDRRKTP